MRTSTIILLLACFVLPVRAIQAEDAELARYARELERDPSNAFYQYAAAQTAKRLKLEPPPLLATRDRERWRAQLYEMTTGALAVQESLQLDRLADGGDTPSEATVPIESVEGLATPEIPFAKLLEGRISVVEPLARAAPADWYYLHAPRVGALRTVLNQMEKWGAHALAAYEISGKEPRVREKIEGQLLLRPTPALDQLYDLVAGEAIVVGSDPYLAEGSDVTVVISLRNAPLFTAYLDRQRREAVGSASGRFSLLHEQYRAWVVDGVANGPRTISSYATVRDDTAIVSTSYAALRRVADTIDGLAPSIASSDDFRYMRSVKPYVETEEEAFLFLSDRFVRRVVGPRAKIGEARRVRCAVTLRSIAFATMMQRIETGSAPASIDELAAKGYVDAALLRCPDGGLYSLEDGLPDCSVHNRVRTTTPNLEISIDRVTPEEAEAYRQFRENYALYWRRFVDPVGVKLRIRGGRTEAEAVVLPLVENSIYSSLATTVGREAVDLARPQAPSAILTFDLKAPVDAGTRSLLDGLLETETHLFDQALGDHLSFQIGDGAGTIVPAVSGLFGGGSGGLGGDLFLAPLISALALPAAVVVPVRDRAALDAALAAARARMSRHRGDAWFGIEGYQLVQGGARTVEAVSVRILSLQLRLYYAVAGDRLILANDRAMLESVADAEPSGAERGIGRLEIAPSRWERIRPAMATGYAEDARRACLENVAWLEALQTAYKKPPYELADESLALLGYAFACPENGRYVVAGDRVACALHGTPDAPRQGPSPTPGSPAAYLLDAVRRVEATFSFTDDGLTTRVVVE
jgi:hypothetical protein